MIYRAVAIRGSVCHIFLPRDIHTPGELQEDAVPQLNNAEDFCECPGESWASDPWGDHHPVPLSSFRAQTVKKALPPTECCPWHQGNAEGRRFPLTCWSIKKLSSSTILFLAVGFFFCFKEPSKKWFFFKSLCCAYWRIAKALSTLVLWQRRR